MLPSQEMRAMEQDLLPIIRDIQFLHDFPDAYLEPLASVASLKEYPPGSVVFREGQKAETLFLVVTGAVSLEFCTPGLGCKRLQTVGAGELLGWSPILGLIEMTATARVLAPTTLLVIDANQLVALCEHNPRFGYEFMRRTALALVAAARAPPGCSCSTSTSTSCRLRRTSRRSTMGKSGLPIGCSVRIDKPDLQCLIDRLRS